MRKIVLILAILAMVPIAVFAEMGVGGAAFYKSPVLLGQPVNTSGVSVDQFSFGGDLRLKLSLFQAEALVLYATGSVNSLNLYLDGGLALDIAILRLSVGAGPNFTYNFSNSPVTQAGLNAKANADIKLGSFSVGLSYIMALDLTNGINVKTSTGLLGVNVLFWM